MHHRTGTRRGAAALVVLRALATVLLSAAGLWLAGTLLAPPAQAAEAGDDALGLGGTLDTVTRTATAATDVASGATREVTKVVHKSPVRPAAQQVRRATAAASAPARDAVTPAPRPAPAPVSSTERPREVHPAVVTTASQVTALARGTASSVAPRAGAAADPVLASVTSTAGGVAGVVDFAAGDVVAPVIGSLLTPVLESVTDTAGTLVRPVAEPVLGPVLGPVLEPVLSPVVEVVLPDAQPRPAVPAERPLPDQAPADTAPAAVSGDAAATLPLVPTGTPDEVAPATSDDLPAGASDPVQQGHVNPDGTSSSAGTGAPVLPAAHLGAATAPYVGGLVGSGASGLDGPVPGPSLRPGSSPD